MSVKAAARAEARARRAAAHAAVDAHPATERLDAELLPFAGHPVAFYMPVRTEIDPRAAMVRAALRGRVLLPITRPGEALSFREWTPGLKMARDAMGIEVPPDTARAGVPDVIVVPALAFDRRGHRLGYGGGFYDRTLAAFRARGGLAAIGFGYEAQLVDALPSEPLDQRIDLLVTEVAVHRF